MSDIKSKGGATIEEGDTVSTPYRGGKHEGKVEQIVTDDKEAQNLGAKGTNHAPAVVFTDQNNKKVAHKPGTVTDLDKES
ncbi:hypothetical protein LTR10_019807 [Elasticomyces elasticus]|uniref:Hypervirulence associated protein TUDOR domain-containing protein n=2 Tax=Exophiala TaxID=5583 RepID=A0A0D1W6R1_9EURO|nr:hypothetical protein EDD36DRAFT_460707 [Exophiala viscosa]KAK4939955.1 hypothetical protein LTR10_019807 [Elasticomyces elasticus]KAK5024391.1 hypothetical protein LTS07_008682 [Exophiala sideris]KAK5179520.1 hypothetical protein LTR44_008036 [Eurotiomycetes sp. CCFEE 6388]KAI1628205.1 hypothetical protein EDD37DRAFT_647856 [Exophiala viscosa]